MGNAVPISTKPQSPLSHMSVGNLKETIDDFRLSSSYVTGGDTLTAQSLGFGKTGRIYSAHVSLLTNAALYVLQVIFPNQGPCSSIKIRVVDGANTGEVANTTDLSTTKFRIEARGKY